MFNMHVVFIYENTWRMVRVLTYEYIKVIKFVEIIWHY